MRKAYIRQIHPAAYFSLTYPWIWDHPLEGYYKRHSKLYGIDGSVLIAVVGKFSIHETEKYLFNAERYALELRNGIIKKFIDNGDKRISNSLSTGTPDGKNSAAFMVYMDYKFEVSFLTGVFPCGSMGN